MKASHVCMIAILLNKNSISFSLLYGEYVWPLELSTSVMLLFALIYEDKGGPRKYTPSDI